MEVFVQGTKGGYKILYPNQAPDVFYSFAKDVRRSDGNGAIGWNIYAVTLLGNGCIFSKYVGLYDELRNYGGYIAFSAFIPLSKKMAGSNVKAMLDEMSDRYCKVYAPYGKITRDPENWAFINEIASRYEGMLQTVSSYNGTSGQINADKSAYLFYSSVLRKQWRNRWNPYPDF